MKRSPNLSSHGVQQRLPTLLRRYVESCRPPPSDTAPTATSASRSAPSGPLPTLAGFCRYLGIGQRELERLESINPSLLDLIRTTLEDELLNHAPSPTLLHSYMKRRLGYGEDKPREGSEAACGQMRLIFEHDIEEDGE